MSNIIYQGRKRHIIRAYFSLMRVSTTVIARRLVGRKLEPSWSMMTEIGVLFWRGQFNRALRMTDMDQARAYFDALQTYTDEVFATQSPPAIAGQPKGRWILPDQQTSDAVLYYLHGGGYTLNAAISDRFAEMLAALTGCRTFALDYRLTPENPHPAQIEDAMEGYQWLLTQVDAEKLVVIGDSAGGHLALMTLLGARDRGLSQPALAIGLCPWTDIGARGDSLCDNDQYDIVPGWSPPLFGEYLVGGSFEKMRHAVSPIYHDFKDLAPIYLQGGGREILIDMIRDFTNIQRANEAEIMLDIWPNMYHDFQANGMTLPESAEAIARINTAIEAGLQGKLPAPCPRTF